MFLNVFQVCHYSNLPYLFAIFLGIGYVVAATLPPFITADFFEGRGCGAIFGGIMLINGLGGAFGAWFAGVIYDVAGSYLPVFVMLIIFALFSSLSIWWVAPRKIRKVPGKAKPVFD